MFIVGHLWTIGVYPSLFLYTLFARAVSLASKALRPDQGNGCHQSLGECMESKSPSTQILFLFNRLILMCLDLGN